MDKKLLSIEEIEKKAKEKKFEYRVIDIAKFNQFFGKPLEKVIGNIDYIENVIGSIVYMSFWAWRGYCFINEMRPNEEILFTEFMSSYSIDDMTKIYNIIFSDINKETIEKIKDTTKIKK